jgi:hypothetical protein
MYERKHTKQKERRRMTVMIYNKKKMTISYDEYEYDYDEWTEHNRFLFTDSDAMCEQLAELITNMIYNEDAYTWNCAGDEYVVEPSYAEGCMWQSVLELPKVREIILMFDEKYNWELPSMYRDKNLRDIPITSTEFGGKEQKEAQEELPTWKAIIDDLPTLFKQSKVRWHDLHFRWNDYNHYGGYMHEVHILTGFTEEAFNLDNFKAVNKTADTYEREKWIREEEEYYASEQYEKDRQEEAERRAEFQTAMGEGGFTSFADNGDGTYTVWR